MPEQGGATPALDKGERRVSLAAIARVFGTIGATSFGGGLSAYLQDALVTRRGWLTNNDYLEGRELSQLLPGPNPVNLSVYLAQRLRGAAGATVAVLAAILPGSVVVLLLGAFYFKHGALPQVSAVFTGISAGAVGLTLATTLKAGQKQLTNARDLLLVALTFLSVSFGNLHVPYALALFAPVGIWMYRPRRAAPPAAEASPEEAPAGGAKTDTTTQ